ncbi:hypothetical protein RIR_e19447_A0A2N1P3M3_9GLOM [Rhizophagus irregularis DAOM 181602=DAOM 197198]|uniref:Uncharacterized protein n=1 Tax=Rhizophagus irregularis TaxID=588596 RepID=A0A2N1P3M3_9GLOM|nr:hypothetical protein RhiirC2_491656 [Rhizophagus irregularis]GET55253.1 hypothetical protein RIR_e19447_A0A2N1P3M3_9GLOM [Rhizophagus irregularis DAOM 181602=DAOM 197198]
MRLMGKSLSHLRSFGSLAITGFIGFLRSFFPENGKFQYFIIDYSLCLCHFCLYHFV